MRQGCGEWRLTAGEKAGFVGAPGKWLLGLVDAGVAGLAAVGEPAQLLLLLLELPCLSFLIASPSPSPSSSLALSFSPVEDTNKRGTIALR